MRLPKEADNAAPRQSAAFLAAPRKPFYSTGDNFVCSAPGFYSGSIQDSMISGAVRPTSAFLASSTRGGPSARDNALRAMSRAEPVYAVPRGPHYARPSRQQLASHAYNKMVREQRDRLESAAATRKAQQRPETASHASLELSPSRRMLVEAASATTLSPPVPATTCAIDRLVRRGREHGAFLSADSFTMAAKEEIFPPPFPGPSLQTVLLSSARSAPLARHFATLRTTARDYSEFRSPFVL